MFQVSPRGIFDCRRVSCWIILITPAFSYRQPRTRPRFIPKNRNKHYRNLELADTQEALTLERDLRGAAGLEEELRRLQELDRWRRQGPGAADANLAALRERVS